MIIIPVLAVKLKDFTIVMHQSTYHILFTSIRSSSPAIALPTLRQKHQIAIKSQQKTALNTNTY